MWGFATGAVPFYISNATCWFTPFLIPYVNHVPVKHDLSDLIEQLEWVKNNNDKAKVIAENALQFTRHYFSATYQQQYLKTQIDKYV
jgi:hypothetical protein